MQKKLIALAIAGAFVAPAAFADSGNVTIYGVMSASYDMVDPGLKNGGGQRVNQINDNSSRLGFKGSEDLGNGLSAVWQIESAISVDGQAPNGSTAPQGVTGSTANVSATGLNTSSTGTLNTRNTFVGLSGKTWGTAILGRHDTPYKLATRGLDVFADGIADNRSLMGQNGVTTFDGRQSNVLAYISPTWNGFHFAAGYVAGAEFAYGNSANSKGNAYSLAGIYGNGPWTGSIAYERHNVGTLGTGTLGVGFADKEEHAWKLGVGYKANAFRVGLAYESTKDDFGAGNADLLGHNSWYLGGGYTFGNNEVKLAYTHRGDLGSAANTDAKQWALGLDHNFSKRTKVFALYTKLSNGDATGMSLVGGSNGGVTTNAGGAPSAWSFGMTHNF